MALGECYDPAPIRGYRGLVFWETDTDIDYEAVRRLLEVSDLSPSPGEAQGMLCGLICGGDREPTETWLQQLVPVTDAAGGDLLAAEARSGLARLADGTLEDIQGPAMGCTILLPDDASPIEERATALYDWVRGFLFALGLVELREEGLGAQTREVLRDFTQITRMDLDDLDEDEENELALAEIAEFVRVAAMLVYQERVVEGGPQSERRSH